MKLISFIVLFFLFSCKKEAKIQKQGNTGVKIEAISQDESVISSVTVY